MSDRPETQFARAVRDALTARGWQQQDLCDELLRHGIEFHNTTISKIVTDKRAVRLDEAAAIAAVLGISLDVFIPPDRCAHCASEPPAGYTCNACRISGGVAER